VHTTITIDINGHPHDIHTNELTGAQIKALGHHEHGTLYRLHDGERHQISDDQLVHLHDHEQFVVVPDEHIAIRVEVDEDDVVFHHETRTGAQIKDHAHRPAGNTLYRIHNGQRVKIADDETVHLKDGEVFVTMPPVGQAS
jgi:gentisate 1,2-dioxygenase